MATWQKSFRSIPSRIEQKLRGMKGHGIVVGCVARLKASDIRDGAYVHLEITLENGTPRFPGRIVPHPSAGRASSVNANGEEVVRRDLPMLTRTFTMETPNFGDWSKGSHDISFDREVYQREFVAPTENEIVIELVGEEGSGADKSFIFRFTVDQPLIVGAKNFQSDLMRLLNLLQESVGVADVFETGASLEDYLRTIHVNWEILPPGERDSNIAKIASGVRNADEETRKRIIDRYDFFEKLKPEALIHGTGGFRRYFGAKFTNDLVAFENMEYGNAVYVMLKDWEEASKKTKQELLATGKQGDEFFRFVHTDGWKSKVTEIIKKNRN
jgi:hypothetical protein